MTSYERGSIEAWRRFLDHTSDGAGSVSPLDALKLSRALVGLIAAWQREQVAGALAEGASWQDIGDALGVDRTTAYRRFGDLEIARPSRE